MRLADVLSCSELNDVCQQVDGIHCFFKGSYTVIFDEGFSLCSIDLYPGRKELGFLSPVTSFLSLGRLNTGWNPCLVCFRADVLVLTAQILVNALDQKEIDGICQFSLLVFDECHHTNQQHPFNCIMHHYMAVKYSENDDTRVELPQVHAGSFQMSRLCLVPALLSSFVFALWFHAFLFSVVLFIS